MNLPTDLQSFQSTLLQEIVTSRSSHGDGNVLPFYPASSYTLNDYSFRAEQADYADFVAANMERLSAAYLDLCDPSSRLLFLKIILFKLLGHRYVAIPGKHRYPDHVAALESIASTESPLKKMAGGVNIRTFKVDYGQRILELNCLKSNIFFTFLARQYYYGRDGVRIQPEPGDHVIDAGGCFGDTAIAFALDVGPSGHVHTFDLMQMHLDIIHENVKINALGDRISIHPVGLSDVEQDGFPDSGPADPGHTASPKVALSSVDAMVARGDIQRVDFIKMDIEGAEMEALRGCQQTIRTFRPKLAISAYHRHDDLFTIIDFIKSVAADYTFHMDSYTLSDGEIVIYATAVNGDRSGTAPS